MFCRFAPENVWKNSLDVRSCFLGFVLSSLGFFVDVAFVFPFLILFKRQSSGSNRTPPHALVLFVPVLFLSRRAWFSAVHPASWCFFGVPFWAPRVFGILLELTGLDLARPFQGPFLDARRQGCFFASCLWFMFSPFCFAVTHVLLEGPPRDPRVISPAARPSEGQGKRLEHRGLVPSSGILSAYFVCQRVAGTI